MIHPMSETIGFIGLGLMGKPMALNLLKKGFHVVAHSRSRGPVDEVVAAGGRAASSASRRRPGGQADRDDAAGWP